MSVNKKIFFLLLFLLVTRDAFCITVGSNFYVSREKKAIFPKIDTDNTMKGFATFSEGFRLEDIQTTCTFDAYYPVGGLVNLNGGKLFLGKDLTFDVNLRFITPGFIDGNNRILTFPLTSSNLYMSELDNEQIRSLQNLDRKFLSGFVNGVDWLYDGNYVACVTDQQPIGSEVQVYSFNGTNLTFVCGYDFGGLDGTNAYKVRWHPSLAYLAVVGTNVSGASFSLYQFSGVSLTQTDVQDVLGDANAVDWHQSGAYLATGSDYGTGELKLWDFDTGLGTAAIKQTVGLTPARRVTALSFAPGGDYLAVGTLASNSASTLLIYKFDGSALSLDSSVNTLAPVRALDWSPTGTYIAVGMSAGIERLRVYKHNAALSTVTPVTLSAIGEVNTVSSVHWSNDGSFLLYSTLSDLTSYKGVCFFNKTSEELLGIRLTSASFGINDIRWAPNNNYVAYADEGPGLSVCNVFKGWALELNNVQTVFKSNVNVNSVWKLSGNCIINGGLYDLAMTDGGRIEVAQGAHVTFKDVVLKNINSNNFFCLTNNGSITFDNSMVNISRDFTFTNGSLLFQNDVTLAGTNRFTYSSRVSSTIDTGSTLYLDTGVTFSYDPPINNKELLSFVDVSSRLYLRNATLHATKYGMRLLKGTMAVEGLGEFEAESPTNPLSIVEFGDQNGAHDFTVNILSGDGFELAYGLFAYRNINSTLWSMGSTGSFMCVDRGATLYLYETINLGRGRLLKYPGSNLIRDTGAVKIIGDVNYLSAH